MYSRYYLPWYWLVLLMEGEEQMTQDEIINKDEILRIARECGDWNGQTAEFNDVGLEHFAALVAEAERNRCLSMISAAMIPNPTTSMFDAGVNSALGMIKSAIEGMK
jgi:hypothetical protein